MLAAVASNYGSQVANAARGILTVGLNSGRLLLVRIVGEVNLRSSRSLVLELLLELLKLF